MMQTICGTCKTPIMSLEYHINGMASCFSCWYENDITKNTCPCPYRVPRRRTKAKKHEPQSRLGGFIFGQSDPKKYTPMPCTTSKTTVTQTEAFIKDPMGGL